MATIAKPIPPRDEPRRPNIASADVQLPAVKDFEQVDREIVGTLHPTVAWFMGLGVAVFFLLIGIATWMYQIYSGLGVAGYNPPVMWGVYIVDRPVHDLDCNRHYLPASAAIAARLVTCRSRSTSLGCIRPYAGLMMRPRSSIANSTIIMTTLMLPRIVA